MLQWPPFLAKVQPHQQVQVNNMLPAASRKAIKKAGKAQKAVRITDKKNHVHHELCIAGESSCLAHYNKHHTITSREIQTTVHLLLPGELAKHAISEGTKAVTKYTSYVLSINFLLIFHHIHFLMKLRLCRSQARMKKEEREQKQAH
ncbi:hypothetical protein LAZ67_8003394 [Cordylochernes scorpioides]|uniref:Histone H2B n=1 Tax=Cordylochernes scorpioides TaxID=51811 RepID=A0ABY6KRZ8_9ARAC|nr:hypothetical protein LAZ67_8003394 [Cordylochernes scorpioides]